MIITVEALSGLKPARATDGSAGFDLRAADGAYLKSGEMAIIGTGVKMKIPDGHVGEVYSRSGFGFNHGVTLANSVGIIDSDFRDEIKVALVNHGPENLRICAGDRIAQIIFKKLPEVTLLSGAVEKSSGRSGGFGSTGVK